MYHSLNSFFVEENQIPLDSESSKYLLIILALQQWLLINGLLIAYIYLLQEVRKVRFFGKFSVHTK